MKVSVLTYTMPVKLRLPVRVMSPCKGTMRLARLDEREEEDQLTLA